MNKNLAFQQQKPRYISPRPHAVKDCFDEMETQRIENWR